MPDHPAPTGAQPQPALSPSPAAPAWSDADLAASPHAHAAKADKVRAMFAAIAGSYDLNNRVHSFGRDQAWRRFAVRAAALKPGDRVLDVACGTGDLTRAFAQARPVAPQSVLGVDFTQAMLDVAERRRQDDLLRQRDPQAAERITYRLGDAMALQLPDASFNVASIAFGLRNVNDPLVALREFHRVLAPGGRLIVLEFDRPRLPIIRQLNDFYTGWVMPRTASLIARDRSGAYRYLPKSVATFLTAEQIGESCRRVGFSDHRFHRLTFGVCICHIATKS